MRYFCCMIMAILLSAALSGCDGSGQSEQSAFHHNNREHRKWVNNPSRKPDYRNSNTGGKLFY